MKQLSGRKGGTRVDFSRVIGNMKNKCNIEIAGISLTLMSEYPEEYVRALSAAADKLIHQMPKSCTKLEAALLCLLDTLDEKLRMEEENGELKKQMENDRLDLEILRIENEKLRAGTGE